MSRTNGNEEAHPSLVHRFGMGVIRIVFMFFQTLWAIVRVPFSSKKNLGSLYLCRPFTILAGSGASAFCSMLSYFLIGVLAWLITAGLYYFVVGREPNIIKYYNSLEESFNKLSNGLPGDILNAKNNAITSINRAITAYNVLNEEEFRKRPLDALVMGIESSAEDYDKEPGREAVETLREYRRLVDQPIRTRVNITSVPTFLSARF